MQAKINRLRWQCRRGMLELDLLLLPFFDKHYLSLSRSDQAIFEQLLSYPDQDLYRMLVKQNVTAVDDSGLRVMIETIVYGY